MPKQGIITDSKEADWVLSANCAGTDPDSFFPEHDSSNTLAMRVCNNCLVKQECLEVALNDTQLMGIWGGTTNMDRRNMRRARRSFGMKLGDINEEA